MDGVFHGQILFRGLSSSRALRILVCNLVCKWLDDNGFWSLGPDVTYRILVERRGTDKHEFFCQTEITQDGRQLWISSDLGESPQEALRRCLDHSTLQPPRIWLDGSSAFPGLRI